MRNRFWRRSAALAAAGLVTALAPIVTAAPAHAAGAGHTLQVSKEITSTSINGTGATLTAKIYPAATEDTAISFEVMDGPADTDGFTPETPDFQCVIPTGQSTCTNASGSLTSTAGGVSRVMAWIDADETITPAVGGTPAHASGTGGLTVEADRAEGRLADNGQTDCQSTDYTAKDQSCFNGTVEPGNTPESSNPLAPGDNTDVVQVTFNTALTTIDCGGAQGQSTITAPASATDATDVPITCVARDSLGQPVDNVKIDGENSGNADTNSTTRVNQLGANDPDSSTSYPKTIDYFPPPVAGDSDFCDTGADGPGTCTATIPASSASGGKGQTGQALLCFWDDTNSDSNFNPTGGGGDGSSCKDRSLTSASELTDTVLVVWQQPHPASLTVSPSSTTPSTTGSVTYTATVRDQFGAPMSGKTVKGEYFSGSVSDSDGNTPTPVADLAGCTTGSDGTCAVPPRSQANAGVDAVCWWGGGSSGAPGAPTMSGTATGTGGSAATCTPNADGVSPTAITKVTWTTPPPPPPPVRSGYWLVDGRGVVYGFGDANPMGSAPVGSATAVDIESTPTGNGYWILDNVGHVFGYGDAKWLGNATLNAGERATSMSANPIGGGYWVFTDKGRAINFGTSPFFGDMSGRPLNGPVIGSVATPSGNGYFMVASDGGIFAFGDAKFDGSMGGKPLNKPVVGLVPDPDGVGYWLDAADGGVFSFDAPFRGSMGGKPLNQPVIGMVAYGNGYLMVASDGGVFDFSDKPFSGSLGSNPPSSPVTNIAAMPK